MNSTERITEMLKELIDKNGSDYLVDKPYEVYKELTGAELGTAVTAGAILMLLASGALYLKKQKAIWGCKYFNGQKCHKQPLVIFYCFLLANRCPLCYHVFVNKMKGFRKEGLPCRIKDKTRTK